MTVKNILTILDNLLLKHLNGINSFNGVLLSHYMDLNVSPSKFQSHCGFHFVVDRAAV